MEKNSQDNVKVSVCISVHNTAKYLPRCLDSVCSQTLQNLEIILVNNGSTDNSEDIMLEYERNHPERKFVIINQEDRSLAGGRQTGVDNASGEYLTFLDADDLVAPDAYEKMLACAERNNVDIVEIQTLRDGIVMSSSLMGLHDSHEVLKRYFTKGDILSMLWLRLYKRSLFNKPVLPTIYTNNEDNFTLPCLLYTARNIYFLNEPLHTYSTDNESGVMHSESNNPELAERRFQSKTKALLSISHFCNYVGDLKSSGFYDELNYYKANRIFNFLLLRFNGKTIKDKENAVKETLSFNSRSDIHRFLSEWLPKGGRNIYTIYRLLGINVAFMLIKIKN